MTAVFGARKEKKERNMPFDVKVMRSQVLYRAAAFGVI